MKEKKSALKTWHQSGHDKDYKRYKNLKAKAKKAVAVAKVAHYDQLYHDLDTPGGANKIYRLANSRHRSTHDIGQVKHGKDSNQQVLRDPPAILNCWSEHVSQISNEEFPHTPILSAAPVHGPVPPIMLAEVKDAIKKMKNGKAPGPDDTPAKAWKLLGSRGALNTLFSAIIQEGKPPTAWSTSITVPIWKAKSDVADCPIRLL